MGRRKTKAPFMEGMIEVTRKNRPSLEKRFHIEIPEDVTFILPPQALVDEDFWDIEKSTHTKRRRIEHNPQGIEEVD